MKLTYFNLRGLAETSRIILAITEQEYEDFRYPLEVIDLKSFQMKKTEFDEDKRNNKFLNSLNKLPFLTVGDYDVPQSKAIERYLATKGNMMGDTEIEHFRIDSICECIRDFKDAYQKVRRSEDRETAMTTWFTETLPERLGLLENIVGRENENFAVGNRLSLADVVIFTFITQFFDDKERSLNSTDNTKVIRNIINSVSSNDNVKSWLSSRPETVM